MEVQEVGGWSRKIICSLSLVVCLEITFWGFTSADEDPNVFKSTTTIKLQKLQFQNIEFLFSLLELCWIEQNTTKDDIEYLPVFFLVCFV